MENQFNTSYYTYVISRFLDEKEFEDFHERYKNACFIQKNLGKPSKEQYKIANRVKKVKNIRKVAEEYGMSISKVRYCVRRVGCYEFMEI